MLPPDSRIALSLPRKEGTPSQAQYPCGQETSLNCTVSSSDLLPGQGAAPTGPTERITNIGLRTRCSPLRQHARLVEQPQSLEDVREFAFMDTTDIYRQAIKRTFANLYSVAHHEVDVSWNKDDDNITVRCADKTFTHQSIHEDDDGTTRIRLHP
jgi:hypothetical protein